MARVSTYVNFPGNTEEAFNLYKSAFGTEFHGPIMRFGDMPPEAQAPGMSDAEKNMIMHIELPILGGHMLMATDVPPSMGREVSVGNNTTISLEPDTKEEVDRLFAVLSQGSTECVAPAQMPWGAYWGVCLDRFGIRWMFNINA